MCLCNCFALEYTQHTHRSDGSSIHTDTEFRKLCVSLTSLASRFVPMRSDVCARHTFGISSANPARRHTLPVSRSSLVVRFSSSQSLRACVRACVHLSRFSFNSENPPLEWCCVRACMCMCVLDGLQYSVYYTHSPTHTANNMVKK